MSEPLIFSGHSFIGEELEERSVQITVQDGRIVEIAEISRPQNRWICPCMFNAHTHIGDTIAMDIPVSGTLSEMVAPPDGVKHRLLASSPRNRLISGMRRSIEVMLRSGTAGFADFREGGPEGVSALKEALSGQTCFPVIFGRHGGEHAAEGLGISSIRERPNMEEAIAHARSAGKLVALHAGEKNAQDIDEALSFEPDLLVHCTHADTRQLRTIADRNIPIAVCPRSNWILKVSHSSNQPPIRQMLDTGCTLLLGTDNVMFVQPDMFQEMAFASTVYGIPPSRIMQMAVSGSQIFGRSFFIEEKNKANFFMINPARGNFSFSRYPLATIVRRMCHDTIEGTILSMPPE